MAKEKQKKENVEKPAKQAKKAKPPEPAEPEKPAKPAKTTVSRENTVLVGNKPIRSYVIACLTCFTSGAKTVAVKARGMAISRAVDTVELLRRAFVKDLQLQSINISTEQVPRGETQKSISSIEIVVTKP